MNTTGIDFLKNVLKNKLYLEKQDAEKLCQTLSLDLCALMFSLIDVVKERAVMPLANFMVGAVAVGHSGNIYFGASQDFCHTTTNHCIHAEQAAVYNAFLHHEKKINVIAVNAAPCGFCRQFLYEMSGSKDLLIQFPENHEMLLGDLLPFAFGPNDLGQPGNLLTLPAHTLALVHSNTNDDVMVAALKAASRSYSPYWESYSGVALQTQDKKIFTGSYLENVAQNPGLLPLQASLVHLTLSGYVYTDIERAVLVELSDPKISQKNSAHDLLRSIGSNVSLEIANLKVVS